MSASEHPEGWMQQSPCVSRSDPAASAAQPCQESRPVAFGGLLAVLGGLYATQGLLGGLVHEAMPVLLRAQGVGLDRIGLLSLLFLPTAVKFLWAPGIDRLTAAGPSQRLHWAARMQLVLLAGMVILAMLPLQTMWIAILCLLLALMVVAVTQDIATDGMAIQTLDGPRRGIGNTMQIGGSYLGYILGGGALVVTIHHFGWHVGIVYLATLTACCTLPAWWLRSRPLAAAATASAAQKKDTQPPSLAAAWHRPTVRWGIATVACVQAPLRWFTAIMLTYLIDRGFKVTEVGLLSGIGIAAAGAAGALLGGMLLWRISRHVLLKASLILHLLLQLTYWVIEHQGWHSKPVLISVFFAFCIVMALGFVVLYTSMMDWSSRSQAGTDFSIFQCTDALCALVFGLAAGVVTHHFGYETTFAVTSFLAGVSLLWGPRWYRRAQSSRNARTGERHDV